MKFRQFAFSVLICSGVLSSAAFTTDTLTISSPEYLPEPMKVTVITPDAPKPEKGFPTVYVLNGYDGDYRSWSIFRRDIGNLADAFGTVLVMPSGMDSWYFDSPVKPDLRMESFFTEVLVPYIDEKYPTDRRAENRAIMGLSMGGHGGLWLGLRHPDIWKSCGSTSGGVNFVPFPNNWKIKDTLGTYDENPDVWESHTVVSLVPSLKAGESNIIFDCGSDDFFYGVNNQLHKALLEAKIPHDYISRPGGHTGPYWANALPYQLMFFKSKFVD